MKNLLSPETAQKLKAAGFPQPEPGAAQYWYDNEILYWVQSVGSYRADVREVGKSQSAFFEFASMSALYYCPTADDILMRLTKDRRVAADGARFAVWKENEDLTTNQMIFNSNLAEALASMWLSSNEKKSKKKR